MASHAEAEQRSIARAPNDCAPIPRSSTARASVGPDTAVLPAGWESRLVRVEGPALRGARGLCLEIHDLVLSKDVAGRAKDLRFTRAAAKHGLVVRVRSRTVWQP